MTFHLQNKLSKLVNLKVFNVIKNYEENMKICPRCESKNIDWFDPQDATVWECKDCNYTRTIIEVNKKKQNNLNIIKIIRHL